MEQIEARAYCPECGHADFYYVGVGVYPVAPIEGLTETTTLICTHCKKDFETDIRAEIHVTTRKIAGTEEGGG